MKHLLMASMLFPLALMPAGAALAQSSQSSTQANAELFYMIQQLQGDVRRLQGQVEEQRNQIDRLTKQARDRYIDLDQRILKVASDVADRNEAEEASSAGNSDSSGSQPQAIEQKTYRQPTAEERKAYESVQALIHEEKKYNQAINGLYDFIDEHKEGDLTINAYYWLGEVYLVENQLEQAKQAFTIVATRFSDHRKAPDAVYKLGISLDRQGDKAEAKRRMETVVRNYPDSNAATLAEKYLNGA